MELFAKYKSGEISLNTLKKAWASLKIDNEPYSDEPNRKTALAHKIINRRYYCIIDYSTGTYSPPYIAHSFAEATALGNQYAKEHNIRNFDIRRVPDPA